MCVCLFACVLQFPHPCRFLQIQQLHGCESSQFPQENPCGFYDCAPAIFLPGPLLLGTISLISTYEMVSSLNLHKCTHAAGNLWELAFFIHIIPRDPFKLYH